MCVGGKKSKNKKANKLAKRQAQQAEQEAAQRRAEEEARQARVRQGMDTINTNFSQFDDGFYSNREKQYRDYAMPQLDRQYADAKEQLLYALARRGLTQSAAAATEYGRLDKDYQTNLGALNANARNISSDARTQIEGARSDLVNQLNASADPNATAISAAKRIQGFQTPPGFSPFVAAFQNALASADASFTGQQFAAPGGNSASIFAGRRTGGARVVG